MEGDTIIMQEIFAFRQPGRSRGRRAVGEFIATGIRPTFMERLEQLRLPPLARDLFRRRASMKDLIFCFPGRNRGRELRS